MWIVKEPEATLYHKGKLAMSEKDLLMSIGNISNDLANSILVKVNYQLDILAKWNMSQWMVFKGIGASKASSFVSSFEIARRRMSCESMAQKRKISSSADAYALLRPYFIDEIVEHFYVIYLSRSNFIISIEHISKGGTNGTVVDSKIVFKKGLELNAACMILAHNHPSNNTSPSKTDRDLTKKLVSVGTLMGMEILDHVICCDNSYFSFSDEGLL